ncbi:MAG TPA: hypothetical protein VFY49_11005 [Myxococcota bacterium]|nr:hypothetical protein [Myxococcota bacterium]
MQSIVKSLGKTLLGLAVVLAWWTIRGPGDSDTETASSIPTVVWDGGSGTFSIHAETSAPAQMRVSFHENKESDDARSLETHQDVAPGVHDWTISVPADVSGYVELSATDPQPGTTLSWTLQANGNTVDEQSDQLEKPLEEGYGFFLQTYFDDYSTGELGEG